MMSVKMAIATTFSAINKVSTVVKKMTADVGGLGVVAARTQTILGGMGKTGMAIGKGIGIAGAATGAAALGIYKLAESVSTLGDDVAKTSRALGLSANALQEFRYIGERSGVSVEEMDIALRKLTVNIGDATSEVSKSLAALGISAAAMRKAGPDEALNMIADGMARIKDPAKRAAIAVDLFGKNGVKMVNVLGEGRAGMAALAKEAHRVGYVLDGQVLDASEELNDMILNMRTSFKALGNQLAARFMPMVTAAVVKITNFLVENRGAINDFADGIMGIFQGIGPMAAKLIPIFGELFQAAMPVLKQIFDGFVAIMPAVIKIAEVIGSILIPVLKMIKPILDVLIPIVVKLADLIATIAENVGKEILKGPTAQYAGMNFDTRIPGYSFTNNTRDPRIPGYTPASTPISSQTSTINRTTRNTLDVNVNNNTPYGVSARAAGPAAPPVTVNTGSMRHPRGL